MNISSTDPAGRVRAITTNWDVAAATDQRLHQIYAYWRSRCVDRELPARSDIDPIDIPKLLPYVFLVEVLSNPRDFRFRLAGTHFREFAGTEVTGQVIGQVFPPEFNAEVQCHWSSCVERRLPKIGAGSLWVAGRSHVRWEGLVLPLSSDGATVDMLLGGVVFLV